MTEHTTHFDDCGCKSASLEQEIEALRRERDELRQQAEAGIYELYGTEMSIRARELDALRARLVIATEALKEADATLTVFMEQRALTLYSVSEMARIERLKLRSALAKLEEGSDAKE